MIWEIVITGVCIALLAFGAWSLIRILKDRQKSDRRYDNTGDTGIGA
jgi:hypothetical protein